jgi:hypothetical protein
MRHMTRTTPRPRHTPDNHQAQLAEQVQRLQREVRRLRRIEGAARALRPLMEDRVAEGGSPIEQRCLALWKAFDAR